MTTDDPREQMPVEIAWLPDLVLSTLKERLENALGQDPWAIGHRSAALAFAAKILNPGYLNAFLATNDGAKYREVGAILGPYMADVRDTRGLPTS